MLLSPNLTRDQAQALFAAWKQQLLAARQQGQDNKLLSFDSTRDALPERLHDAAAILAL